MLAAGYRPLEPFVKSNAKWRCECVECGRETSPRYDNVRVGRSHCKWCAGHAVDPDQAAAEMRAAGVEPLDSYEGIHEPWRCRCTECGRTVTPRLNGIRHGQGGCVWCATNAPVEADAAVEFMRARGAEPLEPFPGGHAKWKCRCLECEREIEPKYSKVKHGRNACPYCSKSKVDAADAVETMRQAGLEPLVPFPGSRAPWLCRCVTCDAEVTPRYNGVSNGQGGCKRCSPFGFNAALPGAVYLMTHSEFRAWQVGITNAPDKRIAAHARQGWDLVELLEFDDGREAERIERAILDHWRSQGWPDAVPKSAMPQGGYTETVAWVNVPKVSLQDFLA